MGSKKFHVVIKDFSVPSGDKNAKKLVISSDLLELMPGQIYKQFNPAKQDDFSTRRDYGRIKEVDGVEYMCKCAVVLMRGKQHVISEAISDIFSICPDSYFSPCYHT